MKNIKILALVISLFSSCLAQTAELETVSHVDIIRYLGTWHEIARLENKYQEGCIGSTAQYSQAKNYIEIKNSCVLADGSKKEVTGRAKIDDATSNAKLLVNFTPWFIRMWNAGWGKYWIIELGKDYDYVVVSEPKMKSLWILQRQKPMSKTLYNDIINRLKVKGFAVEKLVVSKNGVSDS